MRTHINNGNDASSEMQGSFWLRGVLAVRTISGRHGEFNIADLTTGVGTFRIKDQFLDAFQAGKYQGDFEISNIMLGCYCLPSGATISEIRAQLANYNIDQQVDAQQPAPETVTPTDPVDEPGAVADEEQPRAADAADGAKEETAETAGDETRETLLQLFNNDEEIVQNYLDGQKIKLDPSIASADEKDGRLRFRAQRDFLKKRGWKFDATTQQWHKEVK